MRFQALLAGAATLAAAALIGPPATAAEPVRTTEVTSFDGTKIVTHFFPATGKRAPTVLYGPGWGSPGATSPTDPNVAGLLAAGYNVVTWDPRGFGTSGGQASVDYYRYEGRDMQKLISWVATQPEAKLDRPGDPRIGMTGGSYGGGIQFVTAAIDHRVDAIVPTIAWNSLVNSLYPNRTAKTGWGDLLCAYGGAGTNRLAPEVQQTCALGRTGGLPDAQLTSWWADHGPAGSLIRRVQAPTMIVQGTVDTLFPLREGIANYQALRADGTPVKMVWFCGGHGVCLTPAGAAGHVEALTVAWLNRWLKGQRSVATGPGFEYVDDVGTWRGAPAYPLAGTRSLGSSGTGTLTFSPADTSGTDVAAQPAANAVSIPVPAPASAKQIIGSPRLSLRYQGTSSPTNTSLYAQLVDQTRGLVAGNFATALPLVLDGRPHALEVPLGAVAWTLGPTSKLTLQITGGSRLYYPQQAAGTVRISAGVGYPVAPPARTVNLGVN